jgi:hypothetical protein
MAQLDSPSTADRSEVLRRHSLISEAKLVPSQFADDPSRVAGAAFAHTRAAA